MWGSQVSLRVLVVEDDEDWRNILRKQFEQYGCIVTTADSRDSAEASLQRDAFDIVTLDMGLTTSESEAKILGIMGGWLMLQLLAAEYPQTSIFVVSGYSEMDPERAFELGRYGVKGFHAKRHFDGHKIKEWVDTVTYAKRSDKPNGESDGSSGGVYPKVRR